MRAGVGRAPGWERRMKARGHWFGLGGMAGLLVGGAAMTAPRGDETFEARVLAEINAARTDPANYAARLRVADGAVGGDDGWSREDRAYDAAARQDGRNDASARANVERWRAFGQRAGQRRRAVR